MERTSSEQNPCTAGDESVEAHRARPRPPPPGRASYTGRQAGRQLRLPAASRGPPLGHSGHFSDPDREPQRQLRPRAQGGSCGLVPNVKGTRRSLPVNARVWFRPHAADTITSWLRPSMSLGASTLLVSPWPSCPFSFRPADQERDAEGREGGQSSITEEAGTCGSPRRCPPLSGGNRGGEKVRVRLLCQQPAFRDPLGWGRVTRGRSTVPSPGTSPRAAATYFTFSDLVFCDGSCPPAPRSTF